MDTEVLILPLNFRKYIFGLNF